MTEYEVYISSNDKRHVFPSDATENTRIKRVSPNIIIDRVNKEHYYKDDIYECMNKFVTKLGTTYVTCIDKNSGKYFTKYFFDP